MNAADAVIVPDLVPDRLLLIEPSSTTAAPIRGLLEQNGLDVDVVSSPAEARERDLAAFALIIVDVHRRDLEGLQFVEWLHRTHRRLVGRVVVISADDSAALAQELAEMEVCDVVPKPIDAQEILRAVFECLEKKPAGVQ